MTDDNTSDKPDHGPRILFELPTMEGQRANVELGRLDADTIALSVGPTVGAGPGYILVLSSDALWDLRAALSLLAGDDGEGV